MKTRPYGRSLKTRVPVSTTEAPCPEIEVKVGKVGLNSLHEARLVTSLVEYYGWTLCTDGNLYNPHPQEAEGEGDAA